LIGVVFSFAQQGSIPPTATLFLTVGVLGGFTMFSAFSYETLQLISSGNVAGQFAVSMIAVYFGFALVRVLSTVA